MKKKLLLLALALAVIGGVGATYWFVLRDTTAEKEAEIIQPATRGTPDDGNVRLIATGDMIGHDSINAAAKQEDGTYDYFGLMEDMKVFFDKAEVRFCNQSTMAGGESFGISGYPVFNAPFDFTHDLVRLGCNLVNIGTNHTNDKGQPLIDAAVSEWDKQTGLLAVAGANKSTEQQKQPRTFEVEGVTFAFFSYTTYSNNTKLTDYGLNMYDRSTAKQQIEAAHGSADIVLVSMRWGTEYSPLVSTEQNQIAEDLADFGADVVLGHGPHVLEPVKKLNGKGGDDTYVWFSLGNFLNSQIDIESLIGGFAIMDIDTELKKITDVSFLPTYQHYEWTVDQKKREDLLARKNFTMVPLDKAEELLAKSQHDTSVEAQTNRVKEILNTYTPVSIITSAEY